MPNFMDTSSVTLSSRAQRETFKATGKVYRYARDDSVVVSMAMSFALTEPSDAIDESGNQLAWKIVAPARIGLQLRPRDQARDVAAALDGQQRVFLAVQHQGRRLDRLQQIDAIAGGDDRQVLPRAALGIPAAVDVLLDEGAQGGLIRRITRAADHGAQLHAVPDALLARGPFGLRRQHRQRLGLARRQAGPAAGRIDRDQRAGAV